MTKREDRERTQEILEGNRMIAEFEGYEITRENGYWMVHYDPDEFGNENTRTLQDTHYHSSWDWLIPVIKKIAEICESNGDDEGMSEINRSLLDLDIEATHRAVVGLISYLGLPFESGEDDE